jgi:hypothetical protein
LGLGRVKLASLLARHAEANKAADMFAMKSNAPNHSGTPTSSKYPFIQE